MNEARRAKRLYVVHINYRGRRGSVYLLLLGKGRWRHGNCVTAAGLASEVWRAPPPRDIPRGFVES